MRFAFISDIHANMVALRAIKRDIRQFGVDEIICLGDIVGYGPKPREAFDMIFSMSDNIIMGNHDAVVGDQLEPEMFNDEAKRVIEWTRNQFPDLDRKQIGELPYCIESELFSISHADFFRPREFRYVIDSNTAQPSFEVSQEQLLFVGHTHFPGIFQYDESNQSIFQAAPQNFDMMNGYRYLINTGSVGDPRDGDVRASYCILDTDRKHIEFRRIPFDLKIYNEDMLASGANYKPFFIQIGLYKEKVSAEQAQQVLIKSTNQIKVSKRTTTVKIKRSQIDKRRADGMTTTTIMKRKTVDEKTAKKNKTLLVGSIVGVSAIVCSLFMIAVIYTLFGKEEETKSGKQEATKEEKQIEQPKSSSQTAPPVRQSTPVVVVQEKEPEVPKKQPAMDIVQKRDVQTQLMVHGIYDRIQVKDINLEGNIILDHKHPVVRYSFVLDLDALEHNPSSCSFTASGDGSIEFVLQENSDESKHFMLKLRDVDGVSIESFQLNSGVTSHRKLINVQKNKKYLFSIEEL